MPNKHVFVDSKTDTKALRALFGNGDLDFDQALAAVERLQEAGILFAEEIPTRTLGPRTKAEEKKEDAPLEGLLNSEGADDKRISDVNSRVDQVIEGSAQTSIVD